MLGDAAVPTPPTLRELAGRLARATVKDEKLLAELGGQLRGVREHMGSTSDRLLGCLDAAAALLSSLAHLDDQAAHEVRAMTARLLGLVYDEAAADEANRAAQEAANRAAEEQANRAAQEAATRAAEVRAEATRAVATRSGTAENAPRAEKSPRPAPPIGAVSKPGLQTIHDVALGDVMVQLGLIEPYHVEAALREVARSGRRFGGALVELGVCSWDEVQQGLKAQARMAKAAAAAEASPAALPTREEPRADTLQSILLGEVLVQMGKINRQQLEQGLAFHKKRRVRLGAALVALGAISWPDVTAAMQAQERLRKETAARS